MLCKEAQTQTDYSLSDINRLEELKTVIFDAKQRIELIIREAMNHKDLKRRITELYLEEVDQNQRLSTSSANAYKSQQSRFNIKIQKINNKSIVDSQKTKNIIDPASLLLSQADQFSKKRLLKSQLKLTSKRRLLGGKTDQLNSNLELKKKYKLKHKRQKAEEQDLIEINEKKSIHHAQKNKLNLQQTQNRVLNQEQCEDIETSLHKNIGSYQPKVLTIKTGDMRDLASQMNQQDPHSGCSIQDRENYLQQELSEASTTSVTQQLPQISSAICNNKNPTFNRAVNNLKEQLEEPHRGFSLRRLLEQGLTLNSLSNKSAPLKQTKKMFSDKIDQDIDYILSECQSGKNPQQVGISNINNSSQHINSMKNINPKNKQISQSYQFKKYEREEDDQNIQDIISHNQMGGS